MNKSSMIDLKAELYRKKDEFKKEKIASGSYVKGRIQGKATKSDLFSKKNKGVLERAQRDYEEKVEEEDVHAKSRKALEAKAKLYDKISSSSDIPEEDGSVMYLVDFQKKVIDKIVEDRRKGDDKGRPPTSDDDADALHEEVPAPSDPQEEWVDYVDSLGRSRRCMKKELPQVEKQDKEMAKVRGEAMKTSESEGDAPELMSHDMHREMLRQKWEREEEEALKNTNIHYSNVQFDEIRTHGVGFYQFDKNEETRKEQLDRLKDLRKQTVNERGRREKLKEKRKAMLDARLAKVKQRRKLKDGGGVTDGQNNADELGPELEDLLSEKKPDTVKDEKKEPKLLTRDDSWKKTAPVREWDKGKDRTAIFSEERYMSERREERLSDFAPPKMYRDTKPNPSTIILPREAYKKAKPSSTKTQEAKPDIENISDIPLPQSFMENIDIKQPDRMQQSYLPLNVPLPDVSKPPPGMQPFKATQWGQHSDLGSSAVYDNMAATINAPQAGFEIPINLSVPPPGYPCAPDIHQSVPIPMQSTMPNVSGLAAASAYVLPPTETAASSISHYDSVARAPPAQIHIPRATIVDTRLVQNEDSDVSAPAPDVSGVEGQCYQPGSFTAALQADYVTSEDIAAASRLKSQYNASPVIYKHEEETPYHKEQEGEKVDETEDQVATFLKTLRESSSRS